MNIKNIGNLSYLKKNRIVNNSLFTMAQKLNKENILDSINQSYEETIFTLNNLPSNAKILKEAVNRIPTRANTLDMDEKYLNRTNISLNDLDNLSVIHITGTKGKGSTSAYCESILRHHGYRTGFFSSPHLISVRERIRLNGRPIDRTKFISYFWLVYNKLYKNRDNELDMPGYFRFLTVLAFNIFLKEQIDVAIMEVGIGGEFDCTNILRKVPVVGITSIGLDHTSLLGNTLEKIAFQKSGIMKRDCQAFTVKQVDNVNKVLKNRSIEKRCTLKTAPVFDSYNFYTYPDEFHMFNDVQKINASLAIQLTYAWMKKDPCAKLDKETVDGIKNCRWPGRTQILNTSYAKFFLDGAHTTESLTHCVEWFNKFSDPSKRVLIFNVTGNRNPSNLLQILSKCNFKRAFFSPNQAYDLSGVDLRSDQAQFNNPINDQIQRCEVNKKIWINNVIDGCAAEVQSNISDVLKKVKNELSSPHILVTGSLHLVGSVLSIIDPELQLSDYYP